MHFLVTGHTGFKGAWLTVLLKQRGHEVSGVSLIPPEDSLFTQANLVEFMKFDVRCDIRDSEKLQVEFEKINPDIVLHLAAQSLVRKSYQNPMETFETNVIGTLNVLSASQTLRNIKAQVIVTTDKVYKNLNQSTAYKEEDALGGYDPYSASKAMADIATQSWISSFEGPPTAIARAGNVIGGGDIATDRLIPELIRAYCAGEIPQLRFPNAVRPWQHVLDCLSGYLCLVDSLLAGKGSGVWNFGPLGNEIRTVSDVAEAVGGIWGVQEKWRNDLNRNPHEAELLLLDSTKARNELNWKDRLNFKDSIAWTTNWYQNLNRGVTARDATMNDVVEFETP